MRFYPLLEEVKRRQEATATRDELLKKFPKKYLKHSAGNRIKNAGNVSSEEFNKRC